MTLHWCPAPQFRTLSTCKIRFPGQRSFIRATPAQVVEARKLGVDIATEIVRQVRR